MKKSIGTSTSLLLLIFVFASITGITQTKPATPEDRAYFKAIAIKDNEEKIKNCEQFLVDFPKSKRAWQVYEELLETYLRVNPNEKTKILEYITKTTDKAPDSHKITVYENVIESLLDSELFLDEAERLTKKGMSMTGLMGFDEKPQVAHFQSLLAKNYFIQGKLKEAEENYRKALNVNKTSSNAMAGLASLYDKGGDEKQALEYYITASAVGNISKSERARLESLYAKHNGNSTSELENAIGEAYKKLLPVPFKIDKYKMSKKRTNYKAIAEVFTGSGCPPCVGIDVAFDGLLQRYSTDEFIVLMYHQHIPSSDPMTNMASEARAELYQVRSVPFFFIDGIRQSGGGDRSNSQTYYDNLKPIVDKMLTREPEADLKLEITSDASVIKSKVTISQVKSKSNNIRLQIALVEAEVEYMGRNGVRFHPMVVRSLGGENFRGFKIDQTDNQTFEWEFDIDEINSDTHGFLRRELGSRATAILQSKNKVHEVNKNKIMIVAFLQDEKGGKFLQSVSSNLK